MARCRASRSVCRTTASGAARLAASLRVSTLPSIFWMVATSWSRAENVTICPGFHSWRLNRTSTPPLSGCQS